MVESKKVREDSEPLKRCPLCTGNSLQVFLQRKSVPVHQNQLMENTESARRCVRGDLNLSLCGTCGFIFNSTFDLALLSYADDYDNTQMCSEAFSDYVERLVQYLSERYHLTDKRIIEVGCGKGAFLKRLCASGGNSGVGFDPSYEGPESTDDGRLRFVRKFYDVTASGIPADFVVCRHVLEHVPDPVQMLSTIRGALQQSSKASVFFEVPCVDWILETGTFWDFFYEHCSYFSAPTFRAAFERVGFSVESVKKDFGEQYLWLEARPIGRGVQPEYGEVDQEDAFLKVRGYLEQEKAVMKRCLDLISHWKKTGGCAIWGAGAKGVTLLNTLDTHRAIVDYVIDLNPAKQGKFIPGTGHSIHPPEILLKKPVAGVLVMNPNYLSENTDRIKKMGLDLPLISL